MKIPLTRPFTGSQEQRIVSEVLKSGWLTQGTYVSEFENAVANHIGTQHAVACSNCTTALHMALLAYGIGPGDEVVIPSYTWISTANAVCMVGAKPVFLDINIDTFNITAKELEAKITNDTKAVILVHQFGLPVDLEGIMDVAQRYHIIIIEDAACAIGSLYKGKAIGSFDNLTCFSFHPRKVITTGEGGMLLTNDDELAMRLRVFLNHGASLSDLTKHKASSVEALLDEQFFKLGYNYRLTNLQGALGNVQIKRLEEILILRRERAHRYSVAFSKLTHIIPPHVPKETTPNWQSYVIRLSDDCPLKRNTLAQHLLDAGIACRPAYMACHVQPFYKNLYPDLYLPNTEKALESVIILPLYPQMTDEEQDYIVDIITNILL